MTFYININTDSEQITTTHALVDILEHIYSALDDGNYAVGVYVDC